MKLYLLRHADAATLANVDDDRALSEKGIMQSKTVADFCQQKNLNLGMILTSPLLRAQQTAKPVAKKLGIKIETVPWLVYATEAQQVIDQLDMRSDIPSIMLVGHEPDFSLLAETLLGSEVGSVHIRKASLTLLDISDFQPGGACLEWSVPVKMM